MSIPSPAPWPQWKYLPPPAPKPGVNQRPRKERWPYLPPGPPRPKSWGTHSPESQLQKPMGEDEFRKHWNKGAERLRELERIEKAKAAFHLSINETIVYPVLNCLYRIIDWFKKGNGK